MDLREAIKRVRDHFAIHDDGRPTPYLDEAEYIVIQAAKKQVPIKVIYSDYGDNGFDEIIPHKAECPVCGYEFEFGEFNDRDNPYCKCGQKLDWEEGEIK